MISISLSRPHTAAERQQPASGGCCRNLGVDLVLDKREESWQRGSNRSAGPSVTRLINLFPQENVNHIPTPRPDNVWTTVYRIHTIQALVSQGPWQFLTLGGAMRVTSFSLQLKQTNKHLSAASLFLDVPFFLQVFRKSVLFYRTSSTKKGKSLE